MLPQFDHTKKELDKIIERHLKSNPPETKIAANYFRDAMYIWVLHDGKAVKRQIKRLVQASEKELISIAKWHCDLDGVNQEIERLQLLKELYQLDNLAPKYKEKRDILLQKLQRHYQRFIDTLEK